MHSHGSFGGFIGRNFQHGHKPRPFVMLAVQMTPCVSALGLGVSEWIKNLYIPTRYSLALKNLMNGHGGTPNRPAVMQL